MSDANTGGRPVPGGDYPYPHFTSPAFWAAAEPSPVHTAAKPSGPACCTECLPGGSGLPTGICPFCSNTGHAHDPADPCPAQPDEEHAAAARRHEQTCGYLHLADRCPSSADPFDRYLPEDLEATSGGS